MRNPLRRPGAVLVSLLVAAGLAFGVTAAAASTGVTQRFTATVTGTSSSSLTNGVLYVYADATALHHTRSVEYFQHDGYSKTENLVSSARPLGVVLKQEDIENACDSSTTDGSVNPVGGYEIPCVGQLVTSKPAPFPLGGDLIGRFCRIAQLPDTSPADCTSDPIHVNESATGTGQFLKVGNKDHGAMTEIDYYANWTGTSYEVDVLLPSSTPALVTRVVLLPQNGTPPHAVLVLS